MRVMTNQHNRQLPTKRQRPNPISLLTRLMLIPCLLIGSNTPLQATQTAAAVEGEITAEQTCEFFSAPQRYNTQHIDAEGREIEEANSAATESTIVIGLQPNRPYQVIVPGSDEASLTILRTCILDAFVSQARFGPYIHIGSFSDRSDAESLKRILTREGYPARVFYRR